jgi:hypothetical protein
LRTIAAIAMVLVATAANAAPIFLSCAGTAERKMLAPARFPDTVSMTVDLANNALTLEDDPELLPIASVSESMVTVNAPGKWGDTISIFLNRVTGQLSMTTFSDKGQIAWEFQGLCKLARKLF